MPNNCSNKIIVEGNIQHFEETLTRDKSTGKYVFQFGQTVPSNETIDDHIQNWGTKWDIYEYSVEILSDKIIIQGFTAWSPPKKWVSNFFNHQNMDVKITLIYCELGCCFYGLFTKYPDGKEESIHREIQENDLSFDGENYIANENTKFSNFVKKYNIIDFGGKL